MLAEVGLKASPFAKKAGVATSTVTRFLANADAPILSTSTMVKLREARDRLLLERGAPNLDNLTKNAKKRAIIAALLAASDDQITAFEDAIKRAPQTKAARRKGDDNAA